MIFFIYRQHVWMQEAGACVHLWHRIILENNLVYLIRC